MHQEVDLFYERAPRWQQEMLYLRQLVLDCGLREEYKWRCPIYCAGKANVVGINGFKDSCVLSFFKGALLSNEAGILTRPGEHSQEFRYVKLTSVEQIAALEPVLRASILEAVEVERLGLKVPVVKPDDLAVPDELQQLFSAETDVKTAFEALTPGRQKAYLIHFADARQSATRVARIQKYLPRIRMGKGMTDCVCGLTRKKPNCDGSHKLIGGTI